MNPIAKFTITITLLCLISAPSFLFAQTKLDDVQVDNQSSAIKSAQLGKTKNVHRLENLYFANQLDKDAIDILKEKNITRVISLRTAGEIQWDEKSALEEAGISFIQIGIASPEAMDETFYTQIRALLQDNEQPTLVHCGSATRVAAAWLPYRVLDQGTDLDVAKAEARQIGLRSQAFMSKALEYISQQEKNQLEEKSVKPGINDNFKNPELDVDEFVKRFEVESREIYSSRDAIVAACEIKPGQRVADVGAGTGLFTRQFVNAVGDKGWVFAVDISARFIEHINADAKKSGVSNITGVLCTDNSVNLPPESVDVVFICDTYHHFEYPNSTMTSIYKALKPGGRLVVIDFERIPGKSREWLLGHVRAGKQVFRAEIINAGFKFTEELSVAGLSENYCLIFKKQN